MDELELAEALDDVNNVPKEAKITVVPGWPAVGSFDLPSIASVPSVQIGQRRRPATFAAGVKSEVHEEPLLCVLIFVFLEDENRVAYRGGWTVAGEWDEAERWVFSLRSKQWWKRSTFLHAAQELWAHDVADRFGLEPAWSKDDATRIFSSFQENLRDGLSVATTRRRDRITNEVLLEVASVYREAWDAGKNPTKAVGSHFHKSSATASRWVSLARRAGHLGPSDSTRGGELPGG